MGYRQKTVSHFFGFVTILRPRSYTALPINLRSCWQQFETGTRTFLPWDRSCPRLSPNTKGRGAYVEKTSHALFSFTAPLCFSRNGFKIAAYCFTGGRGRSPMPGRDSLIPCHKSPLPSSFPHMLPGRVDTHQQLRPFQKIPSRLWPPAKDNKKSGQLVTANRLFLLWCARRDSNSWPTGS